MPDRTRVLEEREVPADLRALNPPCRTLHVLGSLPPEGSPRLAVVGSRTPSPSGERTAYEIAWGLARAGVAVVSGLARGVDAAAHRGAVDGGGITVAFLGGGSDTLLPRSSRILAERIVERGAVVSEYAPGTPAQPFRFVQRNRLIAGYTLGTLVVEGGARSGALITAGMALGMGKEVWAVPGDPRRPTCRGSNRLLRDGAGAVLEADDLLVACGRLRARSEPGGDAPEPPGLTAAERKVWRSLAVSGPADVETLSRRTRLAAADLLEALSLLELAGRVRQDGEGYALAGSGRGRG